MRPAEIIRPSPEVWPTTRLRSLRQSVVAIETRQVESRQRSPAVCKMKPIQMGPLVAGGRSNRASAPDATISGGESNIVNGEAATVPGGSENTAAGD